MEINLAVDIYSVYIFVPLTYTVSVSVRFCNAVAQLVIYASPEAYAPL